MVALDDVEVPGTVWYLESSVFTQPFRTTCAVCAQLHRGTFTRAKSDTT